MRKSVIISLALFAACVVLLGLGLRERLGLPPSRPQELPAVSGESTAVSEAGVASDVQSPVTTPNLLPDPEHLDFAPPPETELADGRRLLEQLGKPAPVVANLDGEQIVGLLREKGLIPESMDDGDAIDAIAEATARARKRISATMRVNKLELDTMADKMDAAGNYEDVPPGAFHKPDALPKDRRAGVFRRLHADGSARVYIIDGADNPGYFEARDDRMRLIAESLLAEALVAVREHQAEK